MLTERYQALKLATAASETPTSPVTTARDTGVTNAVTTAQAAISDAQAGSEAISWRVDPISPGAQGADNLRPPQQM